MPALNNVSAAEKEDEQLGRSTTQGEEKEEDPDRMDVVMDEEEEEDSQERIKSLTSEEQSESEFVESVELEDIRKYVQCPICLGIIRKTRTVMGCLHRFCQECIDKSMRFGNHECPACRKHCASRRSLRPDPKFDAFIAATFGNIDSNEEQDLAFDEDEFARNKQIQASIAQVSLRQSEALVKRKSLDAPGVLPRSQPSGTGSRRRRRNCRNMEQDDDDGDSNRGKGSSSAEPSAEILPRKRKRRSAPRPTAHPSSLCPDNNDNCANNVTEEAHHRDIRGTLSHGLGWGRGGRRSNARQGNNNQVASSSSKSVRNARLNRLVEYLGRLESNSV
ncbi:putative E3 ubiquitin-protein ligase RING1b [Raphanus sativus]|uniref:E3 ubiquitin-protein ligase RING1b n=1 Tax=Raphanus sativus TaxID=3726 RepID=A0A6J0KX80_RAPSA|nr:putative E3 ubiquitin-protein ligase RING1b [Raphanus sativus]KAJ4873118.1 putative E3 ubiquitin-protein ligase RING1b [Raphanus sativus]